MTSEKDILASLIAHKGICEQLPKQCKSCICFAMCRRGLTDYESVCIYLYGYAKFIVRTKYTGDDEMAQIIFEKSL